MSWFFTVGIFVKLAEYLIAFTFYKDFLGQKSRSNLFWAASIIVYIALFSLSNHYVPNIAIAIPLGVIIFFALSCLFDGSIKLKLLAASLFSIFLFIADVIVLFSIVLIFEIDPNTFYVSETFVIIGSIASKLLVLLIAKIVGKLRNKDNTRLSFQHWIAIVTYPTISCFLIFLIHHLSWQLNCPEVATSLVTVIAVVCVLYFNIVAFYLFEYFADRSERDLRERLLKSQVAAQIKECERLNYEKIAKSSFLHDLKHHNQLLYTLVEKGEANEALKLISKMLKLNKHEGEHFFTGTPAINAIFNTHLGYAEKLGIKINIEDVELPTGVELEIEDICIIFANSLENAIDACKKIDRSKRFLRISLRYRNERLTYQIVNPTDGNVIRNRSGGFKSTKATPGEHGLGIDNIERAVYKYGGVFNAGHNDNTFTLDFSIPVKEPQILR